MKTTTDDERLEKVSENLRQKGIQMGLSCWDAEDLVQDTFSRFYNRRYHYRGLPQDEQEALINKIFRTEWARRLRAAGREREELVRDPEELASLSESSGDSCPVEKYCLSDRDTYIILKEMFRMKKPMRDVLEITAFLGVGGKEGGRVLGISGDVFRKRLSRARKELRLRLAEQGILA